MIVQQMNFRSVLALAVVIVSTIFAILFIEATENSITNDDVQISDLIFDEKS